MAYLCYQNFQMIEHVLVLQWLWLSCSALAMSDENFNNIPGQLSGGD